MIEIIYALSVLILFTLGILTKKKKDKIDIITTFFVGVMVLFCYNIIECLTLRIFTKSIELLPLTIINFIISALILYKIIKDKEIQKFYILKKDIFAVLTIIIITLIVLFLNFGMPFKISFICTDASNHYEMATDFYRTGEIKIGSIPGTSINYGLVFKVFFKFIDTFDGYKVFIILEMIKLIFSAVLFYLTIKKFTKTKISYFIGIVLTLIYMLAYPLNGVLSGFVYLQMAVNIISAIFIIMVNYEIINNKLKNFLLFMLTFGLMFTYYILVPPVYIAIFLYELKGFKENKKQKIIDVIKIFLIPSIIGILYFIILPKLGIKGSKFDATNTMQSDGYIFVNYFSMFIFFIPYNVYYLGMNISIKNKKIDFLSILLISNVIYIAFAIILKEFNIISEYYLMKCYYLLWLIILTITAVTICNVLKKIDIEKLYKFICVFPIIIYVIFAICFISIKGPSTIRVFSNENENIYSMFNIYRINLGVITHDSFDMVYYSEELKILKEVTKDFNDDTEIFYLAKDISKLWVKSLKLIKKENVLEGYLPNNKESQIRLINVFLAKEKPIYIICLENSFIWEYFNDFIDDIDANFNIIAISECFLNKANS